MIDELKKWIGRHGIKGVLHALTQALDEHAREVATMQPRSTAHEVASELRYASKALRATAKRISHHANRVGF